ncbi:hypothetical protein DFW84_10190, partial [Campylobacter coli]|nr:hypothetical protein [Campylobacter coli]
MPESDESYDTESYHETYDDLETKLETDYNEYLENSPESELEAKISNIFNLCGRKLGNLKNEIKNIHNLI